MARQKSPFKFEGPIDDLTFYKTKHGNLVRRKGRVSANRLKKHPRFQRFRENGKEFGRAGKSIRLIRTAFGIVLINASDIAMTGRWTREILRVIKSDQISDRGSRTINNGNIQLVEGFDFNDEQLLTSVLHSSFTVAIDNETRRISFEMTSFSPAEFISAPKGATHFQIVTIGAAIDFDNKKFSVDSRQTEPLSLTDPIMPGIAHEFYFRDRRKFFLLLGIVFFQEINRKMYPLKGDAVNALKIVKADNG